MPGSGKRQAGHLEMMAAMLLIGTVGLFVVESGQSPYNVVFIRCVIGSICLGLYCYLRGFLRNTGLTPKIFLIAALSGVLLVSNWILLFASFRTASISTSTVIYHTQPFFFVLIGATLFREPVTVHKLLWIVLAFFGVVLVADVEPASFSMASGQLVGVAYALGAAVLWAIAAMMVRQLRMLKPHLVALIQVFVGIFALLPFADFAAAANASGLQWGYLFILGFVHTCMTYILIYSALQKLPTTTIAVMTFIYPVVAIIVDYLFYGVVLDAYQVTGVCLILFSSFAVGQNVRIALPRRSA